MRLETLTYRFELEVIKGDFYIDYNHIDTKKGRSSYIDPNTWERASKIFVIEVLILR